MTLPAMLLGWVNENHTYGMERNFTDRIETTFPQLLGATTMTCGLDWNLLVMQSPLKPREAGEYSGSPDPGLTGWELSWGCTFMMRKTNMDYKELVESLEKMLPPKIPYGELVGAPWPYTGQGEMVYEDPESYFIEQAITAITDLLARVEATEARAEKAERERDEYKVALQNWHEED